MSKIGVTVLASGSNGNCAVVHSGSQAIMVDCGISLRTLRRRMKEEAVDESWIKAILITHEHADHIQGARVAARHFGVPIYATARCAEVLRARFEFGMMNLIAACNDFPLSGFNVRAFPVPHDAVDTVGYVFTRESTKIGLATDLGQTNPMANFQLRDCNTLVLESNYDVNMLASSKRPWPLKTRILGPSGHLSNADTYVFYPAGPLGTIKSAAALVPDDDNIYSEFFGGRGLVQYEYDAKSKTQDWWSELAALCVPNRPQEMFYLITVSGS